MKAIIEKIESQHGFNRAYIVLHFTDDEFKKFNTESKKERKLIDESVKRLAEYFLGF